MVIIRVLGGYGNQLFNYALAKKMKNMGRTVKLDWSFFDNQPNVNDYREPIKKYISIDIDEASRLDFANCKIINKIKREPVEICEDIESAFDVNKLLGVDNKILVGYWQNYNIFDSLDTEIREYLTIEFSKKLDDYSKEIKKNIESSKMSISIHVRGGDYLSEENATTFGGICNQAYYEKAIQEVVSSIESRNLRTIDIDFYVFTNDKIYAKSILPTQYQYNFITNDEVNGYMDMYLMSLCDNIIIANSTFSWWGAYLKQKEGGVIIAPLKWKNRHIRENMIRDDWKTI